MKLNAAFALLILATDGEVRRIKAEGAQATQGGDYDTAQSVIDFSKRLTILLARIAQILSIALTHHRPRSA